MSAGNKANWLEQDDRLLVDPANASCRVMVVTPDGPRHIDLNTLTVLFAAGVFTKAEFDKTIDWRLQVSAEQAFNRALEALQTTTILFDKAPYFVIPDAPETFTAPVEPAHLSDARDYHGLEDSSLGLDFICALPVHQAAVDWRGRYAAEEPTFTPRPAAPTGETSVEAMREWMVAYSAWTDVNRNEVAVWRRWNLRNEARFLSATGEHAGPGERLVVLRKDILSCAEAAGVTLDLPGDDSEADPAYLVPALVKAVQELKGYLGSDEFLTGVADRLALRQADKRSSNKKR